MSAISHATVNEVIHPNPGARHQDRDVAVIGARATELFRDLRDPRLEIIDQHQAGVDVRAPRLGHVELLEQSAAGDAEQVGHVALVAEGDQRRVHPVLQRRAVLDQMQPPPRDLPLAPQLERGQPDRRHQIPERQLGQHPRVDFVGLARQRRQPLDLLRVGDQHLPAMRDQLVVHEPRTVHRLHDRADGLAVHGDPASEPVQAVAIRDRREAVDQLPLIGDQAHVNSFTTQIQTNMQHEHSSPARGQAGSIQPTAYLDTGWSVLCFGWPAARVQPARALPMLFDTEGRPPPGGYAARGGPPSSHSQALT